MIEILEGRSMFSAVTPTDAAPAPTSEIPAVQQDLSAGKVAMQDFHFVKKIDKATPTLNFTKIKFNDILISIKVTYQDFHFVM